MDKVEERIIKSIFADIQKGEYPKFGSPEIKCSKCMFCGIACFPDITKYAGCYGGWKKEEE